MRTLPSRTSGPAAGGTGIRWTLAGAATLLALAAAVPASADPPEVTGDGGVAQASGGDGASGAAETDEDKGTESGKKKKGSPVSARYDKGLHIETESNKFAARIRWRLQTRLTDLESSDLVGEEDGLDEEAGFEIRRARFKLDGHVFEEWLEYSLEYEIVSNFLLTWNFDVNRYEKAQLRVGQYKVLYNRERLDSSGQQQFVDRSIVNNPFTVDRQQGLTVHGRLFKDSRADSRYALGVFTGTGRGGDLEGDKNPMLVGRWQWNFLGRDLPFTQSDVKRTEKAAASLALAAATNEGQFTSWSSSGGGQLPGFGPGNYKTDQWMGEFALMRRGLSIQAEYHDKQVDDTASGEITELHGFYGQVGYFFHELFDVVPRKLEFALRHARVDSDRGVEVPADRELTLASNYFFEGHDNKLTLDVSHLQSRLDSTSSEDEGWRVRVQWDIQF